MMKKQLRTAISLMVVLVLILTISACGKTSDPPEKTPAVPPKEDPAEAPPQQTQTNTPQKRIEDLMSAYDDVLYVYKDAVSGSNHFTQKIWMGDSISNIPEMNEFASGYEDTIGIEASLDLNNHDWGGYMFNMGVLQSGSDIPAPNFGDYDAGADLSGAKSLVFYAKGATGKEFVDFFMGGLGYSEGRASSEYPDSTKKISLGYVALDTEWKKFEIPLKDSDLSRIACGFGWVANDLHNAGLEEVRFYIDEIHYTFENKDKEPLFIESYVDLPRDNNGFEIVNFAYLYDNALAAMVLSYVGENDRAMQIADAIVFAQNNDRYFDDGRLRNAYSNGDPKSEIGWLSARGKEYARLPGFYIQADGKWYEDHFAVSTSTGNIAWAMLALCEVYKQNPERSEYLATAEAMGDFILTMKDEKGGFTGGYEGWDREQQRATYKSTEHNIDLIAAYQILADLVDENGDSTKTQTYKNASDHARAFVMSMYDAEVGCFYTGTTADGITISKEVLPLDTNTWAILALGDDFKDGAKVMEFVESNMAVDGGYDFNEDKDGVWFEGTAQAALAYQKIGNEEKYSEIIDFLNANALPNGGIYSADRDGVSTGLLVSGTEIPWVYNKHEHLGATAWLMFANEKINPFS